jgi:hypothetical protein
MLHSLSAEAKLFYCIYYSLLELLGDGQVDEIFDSAGLDPFDLTAPLFFRRGTELLDSVAAELCVKFGEETTRAQFAWARLFTLRNIFRDHPIRNIENH